MVTFVGVHRVYLDNNATTRVDPQVLEAVLPHYLEHFGNASSIHGFGQKARASIEEGRQQVAGLIGAEPKEVVFTAGGTESDNTAVLGVSRSHRSRGDHVITTTVEHPAILRSCERLEMDGFRVTYVPVDRDGLVLMEQLREAVEDRTILISVMHANNEVGTIQPLEEIGALAREKGIICHSDAVQSVGKIPLGVDRLGVDMLSLSGHKFHAPKGVGALYVRQGVEMEALLYGGSHERNRRAGTENVPGAVGLGSACALAREALEDFNSRVLELRDRLESGILETVPDTVVNGALESRMPHVSNISFQGVEGEALLISLDLQGIAVSTGAACASGSLEPSHVLKAMNIGSNRVDSAIRFSLSRMTTVEDIDYVLKVVPETVERMRELSPLYREG